MSGLHDTERTRYWQQLILEHFRGAGWFKSHQVLALVPYSYPPHLLTPMVEDGRLIRKGRSRSTQYLVTEPDPESSEGAYDEL